MSSASTASQWSQKCSQARTTELHIHRGTDISARLFLLTRGQVGVPYLVEREGGWDTTKRWEDTLSLGEQQRTFTRAWPPLFALVTYYVCIQAP